MCNIININNQDEEIYLEVGSYSIFLIGGFDINLYDFSVTFISKKTNEILESKKVFFQVQTYINDKRTKRILKVNINKSGIYKVIFNNTKSIKVRKSNLKFNFYSNKILATENLEIIITKKYGFFPMFK